MQTACFADIKCLFCNYNNSVNSAYDIPVDVSVQRAESGLSNDTLVEINDEHMTKLLMPKHRGFNVFKVVFAVLMFH